MTTEVNVYLKEPITDEALKTKLAKRFNEIHDQKFKQEVNGRPQPNGEIKYEYKEMKHADSFGWIRDNPKFFYIPCHWSIEHGKRTQRDIRKVLKEFGLEGRTELSY